MAGLRLGFGCGHPETIQKLRRFSLSANANILAIACAVASLRDPAHIEQERERNKKVRRFTLEFFESAGYRSTDTQTNFLFVNLGRPAKEFREACAKDKIFVARDFPPMEKTHCRISVGTMDEMQRATAVFANVLGVRSSDGREPSPSPACSGAADIRARSFSSTLMTSRSKDRSNSSGETVMWSSYQRLPTPSAIRSSQAACFDGSWILHRPSPRKHLPW